MVKGHIKYQTYHQEFRTKMQALLSCVSEFGLCNLKDQMEKQQYELESLKYKNEILEAENKLLKQKVNHMESEKRGLKNEYKRRIEDKEKLKKEKEKLENEKERLGDEYEKLNKKLKYYEKQFAKMSMQTFDIAGKRNPIKNKAFKTLVIGRDGECIMTGAKRTQCEVAHIRPFSQCQREKQRYDCNNGILLEAHIHKKYFDTYLISIHPGRHTIVKSSLLSDEQKEYLKSYCTPEKLNLNSDSNKYINYHYMKFVEKMKKVTT